MRDNVGQIILKFCVIAFLRRRSPRPNGPPIDDPRQDGVRYGHVLLVPKRLQHTMGKRGCHEHLMLLGEYMRLLH